VDAAMSTRKRLVIIIDRSGSMGGRQRMNLAKDAAVTVLNTLTPDDFVSKSIIHFLHVRKTPPKKAMTQGLF
jgi:uncharacterized protein with von Willebrand factor type A (vWA) domain